MLTKLKSFLANDLIFYSVLLILVAVASFGLGRLSVSAGKSPEKPLITKEILTPAAAIEAVSPASTTKATADPSSPPVKQNQSATVVGSKTGTKYHLPDCPGAKRIKPANLITFDSIAAAKAAGYTPASNCPGLQ
jgi:Metal binding domain of Ada